MREIKCNNCNYKWEYNGKSKFYASCPRCLRKVKLNDNKHTTNICTHLLVYNKNKFIEFNYHIENNTFILDEIIRTSEDE